MWIGLTGGIASGKTQVSQLLRSKGYPVIDADEISRNLTKKDTDAYQKIVSCFGPHVLNPNLDLDRGQLGQLVFSHPIKLIQLEEILHPLIRKEVESQKHDFLAKGHSLIFYDVPLLFEKKMQKDFDGIVVVATTLENQIRRLWERNNLSREQALLRINAQLPLSEKIHYANWVIDNNNSLENLSQKVDLLVAELEQLEQLKFSGRLKK